MEFSGTKSHLTTVPKRTYSSPAQFCMCCLATDCKLYPLSKCNLGDAYENLTGKSLQHEVHFSPKFCTECAQRLINCNKFRDKSLRAHNLISKLVEKHQSLAMQSVKRINRSNNHLKSNITKKIFEPNHCDYSYLLYNPQEVKTESKCADNKQTMKTNEEKHYEVVFIEPKVEVLNNIKNDDYLDDTIDREMEFIHSKQSDSKQPDIKSDELLDEEYEEVEFLCDSDWDLTKDSGDSDVEFVCVNEMKQKVNNNVVMTPTKVTKCKTTSYNEDSRNVKRKKDTDTFNNINTQDDLKVFTITPLNHQEQLAEMKRKKDTESFRGSAYKCMKCYKGFGTLNTYETHKRRHTTLHGKFQCPVCKIHFDSDKKLRHHTLQNHHNRYSCNKCSMVTSHRNSAVNHGRWHRGFRFKCPHCDEEFSKKVTYLSHLRLRHPSDIVCKLCGFFFVNERGLKVHTHLKHRNEDLEKLDGPLCEPCDVRFASNNAYQQHLTVSPRHIISRFLGQQSQVEESNEENKSIECEQCGVQLEGLKLYRNHFKRHHPNKKQTQSPRVSGKPVLCEQCGTAFKNDTALRDHVVTTHSMPKNFQCDICNKKFTLRTNLIVHMRTHNGLMTTFECPICGKKFPNKANTQRHILIHSTNKPYKCVACEKTFVSASAQRLHVRHAHLREPWPKKGRKKGRASRPRSCLETASSVGIAEGAKSKTAGEREA